jgi:hypothetical protein
MGFNSSQRQKVLRLQQKAEIHYMKKELAGDDNHSSDDEWLDDEETELQKGEYIKQVRAMPAPGRGFITLRRC